MPPPQVTPEEWANMAQQAAQPGIHFNRQGFKERMGTVAANIRNRKILGRPLYEVIADFGAGYVVKTAVRSGVMLAGASTLGAIGAAVVAGAASGAAFAGGKEWFKQARENLQQPLSPEAVTTKQKILERLKDLNPNDWKKLGKVTIKGAVVGASFGLAGGLLADALHHLTTPSGLPTGDHVTPPPDTAVPGDHVTPPPDTAVPSIDTITENIQNLKDIPLAAGSNPWEVATEILKQTNPDAVPSNAEIMEITRALCEQNNIGVPEWGINGAIDEHSIPIGYLLKVDPEVKSVISSILKGSK